MPRPMLEHAWAKFGPSRKRYLQPDDVWAAWIRTRDPRFRDALAAHNIGLAQKVAHRWAGMSEIEYEDLLQLAQIGLLKAIAVFDPAQGKAFSSCAMPWIKGEILHFLRDRGRLYSVPRQARELKAKVRKLHRNLLKAGGQATEAEAAAALGISQDEWEWICEATERIPVGELNEAVHVPAQEKNIEQEEAWEAVRQALQKLPNPSRKFLIEHIWQGLSVEAIAAQHRRTPKFVTAQIETGLSTLQDSPELAGIKPC